MLNIKSNITTILVVDISLIHLNTVIVIPMSCDYR